MQINSNFNQLLDELKLLGEEAISKPSEEPDYKEFIRLYPAGKSSWKYYLQYIKNLEKSI